MVWSAAPAARFSYQVIAKHAALKLRQFRASSPILWRKRHKAHLAMEIILRDVTKISQPRE
jgi:hypothetical protein